MPKLQNIQKVCVVMIIIGTLLIMKIALNCPIDSRDVDAANTLMYFVVIILFFVSSVIMYVNVMIKAELLNISILASCIIIPISSFMYYSYIEKSRCFY